MYSVRDEELKLEKELLTKYKDFKWANKGKSVTANGYGYYYLYFTYLNDKNVKVIDRILI